MQTDLPPIFAIQPVIEETVAAGVNPDWLLVRREGIWILRRPDVPGIRAKPLASQDTPRGRTTTAMTAKGTKMTLRHSPGVCIITSLPNTHGFVILTLPEGVTLLGCAAPRET